MEKMKNFIKYILWIIAFFILSEFLINVGLNSTYKTIERKKDNINQVIIYQAEATSVNGRLRGIIKNDSTENKLDGKFIKIDFYTTRNVNMGSKYIEIDNTQENKPFEIFFKLKNISYYTVDIVSEKEEEKEIEFISKDFTKPEIIMGTVIAMLIFW